MSVFPMKLIIQVPCYNEAQTLGITLKDLPRNVAGFSSVEWLVIDDGSTDSTAEIARDHGVDHIVTMINNQGLARGFMAGLEACLKQGADVIVNTDADNQYNADDIPLLVAPILRGTADMVIGSRPVASIEHFSPAKKLLQKIGSGVVRFASKSDVPDAPSGFRAISRTAAEKLMVFSNYTYTLETIIQAGQKNMAIASVPIRVNADLRPSRLVKSIPSYIFQSIFTIIRIFVIYRPFLFFAAIATVLFSLGLLIGMRFLYYFITESGEGHIQSLILAALLMGAGFQTFLIAFIADLLAANRRLLEDLRTSNRKAMGHESASRPRARPGAS